MTKIARSVEFRIPCDDESRWSVSFTRDPAGVYVGLHFGDKLHATHGVQLTLAEFKAMFGELCADGT